MRFGLAGSCVAVVATVCATLFAPVPALAGPVTIQASGEGWCNRYSYCNNNNPNIIANTYASDQDGYRNWFSFSVPTIGTITSATLNIWNDGNNFSYTSSNTYFSIGAFDISYDGLSNGPTLGHTDVTAADDRVNKYVSIDLNAEALTLLTSAEGADFLFGGISSAGGGEIFGYTGGSPVAYLTLDATVPEPASLVVLGAGLAGLGLSRRKRAA